MNEIRNVHVLVEGQTEESFIRDVLAPYCAHRDIYMTQSVLTKKGSKGGDIRFSRSKKEIRNFLCQRKDLIVSTFVDFYGIKEWPGTSNIPQNASPQQIADLMNNGAKTGMKESFPDLCYDIDNRYVPYTAVHEFETLLFSDCDILANELNISPQTVHEVLHLFGEAERINNSPETAPSKRLLAWNPSYSKTRKGITIAKTIGIYKMRKACPLFNAWLNQIGVTP